MTTDSCQTQSSPCTHMSMYSSKWCDAKLPNYKCCSFSINDAASCPLPLPVNLVSFNKHYPTNSAPNKAHIITTPPVPQRAGGYYWPNTTKPDRYDCKSEMTPYRNREQVLSGQIPRRIKHISPLLQYHEEQGGYY